MRLDFTPRAVYRGQIAVLERQLRKEQTDNADLRTQINAQKHAIGQLNDELAKEINDRSQRATVSQNIINDQRKKIRTLEKEIVELRVKLGEAPTPKRFYRSKNGRFAKKTE